MGWDFPHIHSLEKIAAASVHLPFFTFLILSHVVLWNFGSLFNSVCLGDFAHTDSLTPGHGEIEMLFSRLVVSSFSPIAQGSCTLHFSPVEYSRRAMFPPYDFYLPP